MMNINRRWLHKNLLRYLDFDKRQRFGLQTIISTFGLIITQFIWNDYQFLMVFILSILSYFMTLWSLKEDVKGSEYILLFILPVFFTASTSLFYFLLPQRMIIRLSVTVFFAVGTYAVLLVENIYNVASERSIQLLRAAQSIGLLITLSVIFLVTNILFSLKLNVYQNLFISFAVYFLPVLQSLWTARLDVSISRQLIIYSIIVSLILSQINFALSFWPMEISNSALMLAASYYGLIGIVQQYFQERLFINTVKEYIYAFIFTFVIVFVATRWG